MMRKRGKSPKVKQKNLFLHNNNKKHELKYLISNSKLENYLKIHFSDSSKRDQDSKSRKKGVAEYRSIQIEEKYFSLVIVQSFLRIMHFFVMHRL